VVIEDETSKGEPDGVRWCWLILVSLINDLGSYGLFSKVEHNKLNTVVLSSNMMDE
jgi:hypothetical protein